MRVATVDADGVALAAIQGLNQKVETGRLKAEGPEQKLEQKETEIIELKQTVAELKESVQALDQKLSQSKGDWERTCGSLAQGPNRSARTWTMRPLLT